MDILIQPFVLPVCVHVNRRREHGVINRGIEIGLLAFVDRRDSDLA